MVTKRNAQGGKRTPNKYGAIPTVVDGIRFASKLEAARYRELRARQHAGVISNLERQVWFAVYWPGKQNAKNKRDGLLFNYVCDFQYVNADGETIVEDVKGKVLDAFRLKKKGVWYAHGIHVAVVTRKRSGGRYLWFFDGKPEEKCYFPFNNTKTRQ